MLPGQLTDKHPTWRQTELLVLCKIFKKVKCRVQFFCAVAISHTQATQPRATKHGLMTNHSLKWILQVSIAKVGKKSNEWGCVKEIKEFWMCALLTVCFIYMLRFSFCCILAGRRSGLPSVTHLWKFSNGFLVCVLQFHNRTSLSVTDMFCCNLHFVICLHLFVVLQSLCVM